MCKKYSEKKRKPRKVLTVVLSVILSVVIVLTVTVFAVIPAVDKTGLRYLAVNAAKSYFTEKTNDEVNALLGKTEGFITGICTPDSVFDNETTDKITDANIGWVRIDLMTLPYNIDTGAPVPEYYDFKASVNYYKSRGLKVMCITPYPDVYMKFGCDPRTADGKKKLQQISEYLIRDMQGFASAIQITNEMNTDRFRYLDPNNVLTLEEAAEFIGIQAKAMFHLRDDIIIGYNITGLTAYSLMELMKPYNDFIDYVGLDMYCGCFEPVMREMCFFTLVLRAIWNYTHKPVLLNEFGYISNGKKLTKKERDAVMQSYGYKNEAAAKADVANFFEKLPEPLKATVMTSQPKDDKALSKLLFTAEYRCHIYKEVNPQYKMRKYEHSPDGQAKFFTDAIEKLPELDFLCGMFVYCLKDQPKCYVCKQSDCPMETSWGLLDKDGNPKPSYYAVRDAFGKVKKEGRCPLSSF